MTAASRSVPDSRPSGGAGWIGARLDDKIFAQLGEFITARTGIRMPASKRLMMESRLRKRLRANGLNSFKAYLDFLFKSGEGEREQTHLLDALTTNKTDFFREPGHFDFLVDKALPELRQRWGLSRQNPLRIWSAGCSSGEEVYTLAMVCSEESDKKGAFSYELLGTDISTEILQKASRAVYTEDRVIPVPESMKKKYLLRSRDPSKGLVRIAPEMRRHASFGLLNLMDKEFRLPHQFHIIFCRNVMIYFDRPTQEALINRFCRHLVPGGWLFIGHSESMNGMSVPLDQIVPTVYKLRR